MLFAASACVPGVLLVLSYAARDPSQVPSPQLRGLPGPVPLPLLPHLSLQA